MSKPIFAKYLPVEGEIKEGSIVQDSLGYYCIGSEEGVRVYKEAGKSPHKLFLCSRDIKVGDKVWTTDYNLLMEGIVESFYSEKEDMVVLNTLSPSVRKTTCFKKIGEVSPDAVWVKEGDEFDDYKTSYINQKGTIIAKPENKELDNFIKNHPLTRVIVSVKGPCGHYH